MFDEYNEYELITENLEIAAIAGFKRKFHIIYKSFVSFIEI